MLMIVSLTPPKTFLVTRKILAPGEEENLELEEDEEDGAGAAGSTEVLPSRSPGTARLTITARGLVFCCLSGAVVVGLFDLHVVFLSLSVLCMAFSLIPVVASQGMFPLGKGIH